MEANLPNDFSGGINFNNFKIAGRGGEGVANFRRYS